MLSTPALVLLNQVKALPEAEQEAFVSVLSEHVDARNGQTRLDEAIHERLAQGLHCPHCQADAVRHYGTYRGHQRFFYNGCRKTFTGLTGSPVAGLKLRHKWTAFVGCVNAGMSLRRIVSTLEISLPTAFAWRHKLMQGLAAREKPVLEGIVESDETFVRHSDKGEKHLERESRTSGEPAPTAGVSNAHECIVLTCDRQGHLLAEAVGTAHASSAELSSALERHIAPSATLVTDGASAYAAFARHHHLAHVVLNDSNGETKQGIYSLGHVNAEHNNLKLWLKPFRGVRSKHLNRYLALRQQQRALTAFKVRDQVKRLFVDACSRPILRPTVLAAA